jgi:hypothetical protein
MADLQNGRLVQHATLGVGKVVALEHSAVHVFFPESDTRFAAKLRLPNARTLLRTDGFEPNAWLEGLSAFAFDVKAGRYALAVRWISHHEAVAQFLAMFPGGCGDRAYLSGKAARAPAWRAASAKWAELFGEGQLKRFADPEAVDDLVKRLVAVDATLARLHLPGDERAVVDALSSDEAANAFCAALVEVLSVPSPARARFEKLFAAARGLPVDPAQQWLVATLFPFLASPRRQVLMRPKTTGEAAARLGCDLGDAASPNWASYAALRTLSDQLLATLEPNGATDHVDVEAFLHVTATAKRRVPSSER